jgi:chemotaxis protein histidine kinase CheA
VLPLKIKVSEAPDDGRSYRLYNIQLTLPGSHGSWCVQRRFRDFLFLRDALEHKLGPAEKDKFPPKHPLSSSKAEYVVQERLEKLPQWLIAIAGHENVSVDAAFRAFLGLDLREQTLREEADMIVSQTPNIAAPGAIASPDPNVRPSVGSGNSPGIPEFSGGGGTADVIETERLPSASHPNVVIRETRISPRVSSAREAGPDWKGQRKPSASLDVKERIETATVSLPPKRIPVEGSSRASENLVETATGAAIAPGDAKNEYVTADASVVVNMPTGGPAAAEVTRLVDHAKTILTEAVKEEQSVDHLRLSAAREDALTVQLRQKVADMEEKAKHARQDAALLRNRADAAAAEADRLRQQVLEQEHIAKALREKAALIDASATAAEREEDQLAQASVHAHERSRLLHTEARDLEADAARKRLAALREEREAAAELEELEAGVAQAAGVEKHKHEEAARVAVHRAQAASERAAKEKADEESLRQAAVLAARDEAEALALLKLANQRLEESRAQRSSLEHRAQELQSRTHADTLQSAEAAAEVDANSKAIRMLDARAAEAQRLIRVAEAEKRRAEAMLDAVRVTEPQATRTATAYRVEQGLLPSRDMEAVLPSLAAGEARSVSPVGTRGGPAVGGHLVFAEKAEVVKGSGVASVKVRDRASPTHPAALLPAATVLPGTGGATGAGVPVPGGGGGEPVSEKVASEKVTTTMTRTGSRVQVPPAALRGMGAISTAAPAADQADVESLSLASARSVAPVSPQPENPVPDSSEPASGLQSTLRPIQASDLPPSGRTNVDMSTRSTRGTATTGSVRKQSPMPDAEDVASGAKHAEGVE